MEDLFAYVGITQVSARLHETSELPVIRPERAFTALFRTSAVLSRYRYNEEILGRRHAFRLEDTTVPTGGRQPGLGRASPSRR